MENYNRVKKEDDGIYYLLNDKLHRIDGPAYESISKTKEWWKNGRRHRLDGPAYECYNGEKYWFYEGELISCASQEEFEKYIKLRLFW